MTTPSKVIAAPDAVAFIGLGQMGLPMARNLAAAGFEVRGYDVTPSARDAYVAAGGQVTQSLQQAVDGAAAAILMLPNGAIVRSLLQDPGVVSAIAAANTLVIDMSSSAPFGTAALGQELAAKAVRLIDAPVSGGVKRAREGKLAIMVGGDDASIDAARHLFEALGNSVFPTGPLGSAHAMKALNNFVSSAGLVAAAEALIIGGRFGLQPEVIVDVLNASSGRNNATEVKMKQFVLSGAYNSGFGLALMSKDVTTAAELSHDLGMKLPSLELMAGLWAQASRTLAGPRDHTEIYRYLEAASGEVADGPSVTAD